MSKKTRHKQRMEAEQRAAQARKLERMMRAEADRLRSINASETFITQRMMRMAFEVQSLEEKERQSPFLSGRMMWEGVRQHGPATTDRRAKISASQPRK